VAFLLPSPTRSQSLARPCFTCQALASRAGIWPTSDQFAQLAKLDQFGVRYIPLPAAIANCGLLLKGLPSILDHRVVKSVDPNAILQSWED